MTPDPVSFLVGALFGACIASVALVLWAWEAMSPWGAPELPTSADQGSGKGQVPAGDALSALERYAQKVRE
jgi:hypothetical protein